jgi:hypothetical protein
MKMRFFLFAFLFGMGFVSCEKNNEIYFPPNGLHGPNLLVKGASSVLTADENYSMRADLSPQSKLKVIFTNTSTYTGPVANAPKWIISGENDWNVSSYVSHVQEFSATRKATKADLAIKFVNSPGTAKIEFYENSNDVTKTIMVTW